MNGHLLTAVCQDPDRHVAWALVRIELARTEDQLRQLKRIRTQMCRTIKRLQAEDAREETWYQSHARPIFEALLASPGLPAGDQARFQAPLGVPQ